MLTRSPSTQSTPPVKISYAQPLPASPTGMAPHTDPSSQYSILEKLGTGSFGTVYKGMHNDTKQIVAIKQIGACLLCA